jgi:hypothetical protein
MIEGLNVTVSGSELRDLCHKRAEHCSSQAIKARTQGAGIEDDELGETGYTNGDPVRALKDLAERYEQQSMEMRFYGDHIDLDEKYLLSSNDLRQLGIVKSRGY